jgi:hypothetical protein
MSIRPRPMCHRMKVLGRRIPWTMRPRTSIIGGGGGGRHVMLVRDCRGRRPGILSACHGIARTILCRTTIYPPPPPHTSLSRGFIYFFVITSPFNAVHLSEYFFSAYSRNPFPLLFVFLSFFFIPSYR